MKTRRKLRQRTLPLAWKLCVRSDGWYGYTVTGAEICYVYQPWDNRIRRGSMLWQVYCYFGPVETPLKGTARYGKFTSARIAKLAAQRWWKSQVIELQSQ